MPDRVVKTTLIIDDHGSVKVVKGIGDESVRTEKKLSQLDKGVQKLGRSFGGLKSVIGYGLGALGVGGLAFGLADIAKKTGEVATETEKFHTITGLGATSSLYYTQALKARGLSGEAVSKAFGFLAKNIKSAELQESKYALTMGKATAKGKVSTAVMGRQAAALKELGINLSQFNKLTEQQKLEQITKKFEALAPGIRKTRLERELFGRGGNQLSTVLEKNNLGLSHQIDLVKKFFPTIKGGANAMKELLEKQAESKMAWEGLEFTIGQKLIPVMTAAMGFFSKVVLEVEKGQGVWGELRHTFEGIASAGASVFGFIKNVAQALGVKLPTGTLGAVLLAAFGAKHIPGVKTGGKAASKSGKVLKGAVKYGIEHPYAIPLVAALGGGAYAGTKLSEATPEGLFPNAERPLFGPGETTSRRFPRSNPQGRPAAGAGETARESALVSKLIESLKPTNDKAEIHLHLDSVKVAEAVIHSTRARRILAEATAIYAQGLTARK